jgi:hypothetical protein
VNLAKNLRVGEALTKSMKSRADLGGAMVDGEVLKRDLTVKVVVAVGKSANRDRPGCEKARAVSGGILPRRGVALLKK